MQNVPRRWWIPGARSRIRRQVLFPDLALDLRFGLGITPAVIADPFGLVDDPVFVAVPFLLRPPSHYAASLFPTDYGDRITVTVRITVTADYGDSALI